MIVFVFLHALLCLSLPERLMTEHLDGSYPLTEIGKSRSGIMDIKMLTLVICCLLDIYHIGRELLFII